MSNLQPLNQVILHIKKAFQDELITDSGLKLFLDSSYRKEWNVSVIASIEALPINCNPQDKSILSSLNVGDEVAVSYQIVSDLEYKSDKPQFMPVTEGNDMVRRFVNGKGEWLNVVALPGKISPIWVGYYQDKYRNLIDGVQGTQSEVERWLSQFPIGKTDVYSFNNFFEYEGKDYWKCELSDIFAKKVKGHLVAVGDRVICTPIDIKVPKEKLPSTMHHSDVKIRYQDRAKLLTGGKSKGLKKDQIISFNPNHVERYEFWGKPYYLINENLVLGTWQAVA